MDYGDKPFGLRDVKLTNLAGTTQVDLPVARTLGYTERVKSGELSGDDALQSVVAFLEAIEWELENGGIPLEALSIITGRTATEAGTTPNRTLTMTASAGAKFPYFKIYGKSLGEGDDDVHVKFFKAKCTSLEGTFGDGEFFITSCSGIAVDDGTNGIVDIVQNETAAALPSS
jgi:hypothetical protein